MSYCILDGEGDAIKRRRDFSYSHSQADEFVLKDNSDNTRALLFVTEKHKDDVTLPGMSSPVLITFNPTPTLIFYDEKGQAKVMLDDSHVSFVNSLGQGHGSFGNGFLSLMGEDGAPSAWMAPGGMGVSDKQGFSADLGLTSLVTPRTGETQKTSAASLVLFNKNKTVIWKAP